MIRNNVDKKKIEIKRKELDKMLSIYLENLQRNKNDTIYANTSFILLEKFSILINKGDIK